jgi:hypothetical protein
MAMIGGKRRERGGGGVEPVRGSCGTRRCGKVGGMRELLTDCAPARATIIRVVNDEESHRRVPTINFPSANYRLTQGKLRVH